MVKWIGNFSLLLKRLKDSWMDMFPMSALRGEQGQHQHLADVAQENAERLTRGQTASDPNTPENRERWNAAQVSNHDSLFPSSDNLATLLFIVASDLSEAQRERETHQFPFSQRIGHRVRGGRQGSERGRFRRWRREEGRVRGEGGGEGGREKGGFGRGGGRGWRRGTFRQKHGF